MVVGKEPRGGERKAEACGQALPAAAMPATATSNLEADPREEQEQKEEQGSGVKDFLR